MDFFAFTAERGQTYQIDVGLGTLGDSVATLYDSDVWPLEFNDDHGGFWASRIIWTATESAVQFVAVEGYGTGSYTLTIAESETMPVATPEPVPTAAPAATAIPTATAVPTATAIPHGYSRPDANGCPDSYAQSNGHGCAGIRLFGGCRSHTSPSCGVPDQS